MDVVLFVQSSCVQGCERGKTGTATPGLCEMVEIFPTTLGFTARLLRSAFKELQSKGQSSRFIFFHRSSVQRCSRKSILSRALPVPHIRSHILTTVQTYCAVDRSSPTACLIWSSLPGDPLPHSCEHRYVLVLRMYMPCTK